MKTKKDFIYFGEIQFAQDTIVVNNKKVSAYTQKQAAFILAKELSDEGYFPKRNRFEYFAAITKARKRRALTAR